MNQQPSDSSIAAVSRAVTAFAWCLALMLMPTDIFAQTDQAAAVESQPSLYWVFLITGKPTAGVDSSEIEKMQAAHLENFRKLAEDGRLVTAGPLSDPEGRLRGIVILNANGPDQVAEMFKPDPYIQEGYMEALAIPMKFEMGKVHTRVTPKGMDEFRMAVFEASPDQVDLNPATEEATQAVLQRLYNDGRVLLSIRLNDRIHLYRQVVIFAAPESDDELSEQIAAIPALKTGAWTHRLMPLYMGKGSLARDE